jgi:multiple sugar transport system permease protein
MTAVAQPPSPAAAIVPGRSRLDRFRLTRTERKNLRTGLLFISPWLIGFFAFTLYPALASLYYSFTNFKILQSPSGSASTTTPSCCATRCSGSPSGTPCTCTLIGVPLSVLVALSIALLLNRRSLHGIGIFRTIFYLPVVIPAVAPPPSSGSSC